MGGTVSSTRPPFRTLESGCESFESVGLRGTPVSDAVFGVLARMPGLSYVDLVGTDITRDALQAFTSARPGLKHYPRNNSPERGG